MELWSYGAMGMRNGCESGRCTTHSKPMGSHFGPNEKWAVVVKTVLGSHFGVRVLEVRTAHTRRVHSTLWLDTMVEKLGRMRNGCGGQNRFGIPFWGTGVEGMRTARTRGVHSTLRLDTMVEKLGRMRNGCGGQNRFGIPFWVRVLEVRTAHTRRVHSTLWLDAMVEKLGRMRNAVVVKTIFGISF